LYDELHRIFAPSNNFILFPNLNNPSVTSIATLQLCIFPHWISVWCIFVQLQRSGFHHCRDPPSKKHLIGFFRSLYPSSFFAHSLRAYVIHGPILRDQDWTVQGYDEILITIENKLRIHQSLVATSDHRFYVVQVFSLFTSIVNIGRGPLTGSDSTAPPPLRKQRLRH
jgi:hypothetical protein